MKRIGFTAAVAALVTLSTAGPARAQSVSDQQDALRRQIERRFEVLPLRNGVALRPKNNSRGVRSIELADGTISIDGAPASGAELRDKLGADADLVLRLSYLDPEARRRLMGGSAAPSAIEPSVVPPLPPLPPLPPERERRPRRDHGGDRVRIGGSVAVNEGEVVTGDVVAIGGSARVDGEVTGDVVAIAGSLDLGPHADVHGDAVVVAGSLNRDPGARVGGQVVNVGFSIRPPFNIGAGRSGFRRGPFAVPFGLPSTNTAVALFSFVSTLARVAVLCILTSLVLLIGPQYVEQVSARAAAEPVKAGVIGLLAQILFIPVLVVTIVVLVVTIIGIPLLLLVPFALLAMAVIALVGFTAVARNVGQFVNRRFGWREGNSYLTAIAGIVLLVSPALLARLFGFGDWLVTPLWATLVFLGFLVEYVAWTIGFGAVALLRFGRPITSPAPPPPIATA